jgi:hypothetical protein
MAGGAQKLPQHVRRAQNQRMLPALLDLWVNAPTVRLVDQPLTMSIFMKPKGRLCYPQKHALDLHFYFLSGAGFELATSGL